jgi:hypothetical protein
MSLTLPETVHVLESRAGGGRRAILIIASHKANYGSNSCEAFLLATPSDAPLRTMLFRYGAADFHLNEQELGLANVEDIAKDWAVGELENDWLVWQEARGAGAICSPELPRLQLVPTRDTLARFWLSGLFPEQFRVIARRTHHGELRNFLTALLDIRQVSRETL